MCVCPHVSTHRLCTVVKVQSTTWSVLHAYLSVFHSHLWFPVFPSTWPPSIVSLAARQWDMMARLQSAAVCEWLTAAFIMSCCPVNTVFIFKCTWAYWLFSFSFLQPDIIFGIIWRSPPIHSEVLVCVFMCKTERKREINRSSLIVKVSKICIHSFVPCAFVSCCWLFMWRLWVSLAFMSVTIASKCKWIKDLQIEKW